MHGDDQVVVGEDVDAAGPAFDGCMSAGDQLGVEEGVAGVGLAEALLLPTLRQQVHVEVDHLNNDSGNMLSTPRI